MNNFWSTLGVSVTGSVLISGILVWLCREWISARLRKSIQHEYDVKLEEFKALQQKELEGYKAGYQKFLTENETRFRWWHDKQAEALQEIYAMLIECQKKYCDYFEIENESTMKLTTEARKLIKYYRECYFKYKKNQIFVPNKILKRINELFDILNVIVVTKRSKGYSDADRIQELANNNFFTEQRFEGLLSLIRENIMQILHPAVINNKQEDNE